MTNIILASTDTESDLALATSIRTLRPDWQITAISDGECVLRKAENEKVDCLLADIALTDMSGAELLSRLQINSPETIRLTLTNELNQEVILESTHCNHRFINRAVSDEMLVTAIESSLRLRDVLSSEALKQSMNQVKNLPSLPDIYQKMVDELTAPQSSLQRVAFIIEADAGLTATVLKIVNSAFYGMNQRVESVSQAVSLLGVHLIKNITLTAKVFVQFEAKELDMSRLRSLNEDANRVGALCNQFARVGRAPRSVVDHTQIAGMLSNVGQLVALLKQPAPPFPDPELMGAHLLRQWQMPDTVVESIALQYESPPHHSALITPVLILHAARYLEENLTDTNDVPSRQACLDYLKAFVNPVVAEKWLESFTDQHQLAIDDSTDSIRAA